MENLSIGVFDSGVGGLTVLSELIKLLPNENFIYFGDIAHLPYGSKSSEAIKKFSFRNTAFLIEKGIKLLVVACNTSTAIALDYLKSIFNIPIIGVIEPAVEEALSFSFAKSIGVIGTKATVNSNKYKEIINSKNKNINVIQKATPLFVPLIEEGWINNKVMDIVIDQYLCELKNQVDVLILGCTHYPIIKRKIENYFEGKVKIVDSSQSTSRIVFNFLEKNNYFNNSNIRGNVKIYFSDDSGCFNLMEKLILNKNYGYEKIVIGDYTN
ncbi:MAG: glutamate racemase [Spirochaetes bacterium]|nr:glutamate racemase [Spirochaetota bacterium]